VIRATRLPDAAVGDLVTDPGILAAYLEDASGTPPGTAAGLLRVASAAHAAAFLRRSAETKRTVLFQAARSSLTAGAVPHGEVVLSVEQMTAVDSVQRWPGGARVRAQPGVRLVDLQRDLGEQNLYYPPVPTYQEAMLGGTVSTNAGGASSFKYGVTRDWVHGLEVLLFNGDLLVLERGQARAGPTELFSIQLTDGTHLRVPAPDYRLPPIKKISAGYHAADSLDLVDLFVGSEGTLGLIVAVTVDLLPLPPSVVTGLAFVDSPAGALALATVLRETAVCARGARDPRGPDVRAIESIDRNSLRLLAESGRHRELRVPVPDEAQAALLFEVELPERTSDEQAQRIAAEVLEGQHAVPDVALTRLFHILLDHGALETLQLAFPEDSDRRAVLNAFREAVPTRVNELLAERRRADSGVHKVGGDLIVPFDHLREMIEIYERGFRRRGLEYAIWGHLSDGNLHPNALPRNSGEVRLGLDAMLEFAEEATRRGGAPLSEHGVGRSPIKQEILRRFLGDDAIASMRRVKRALDPGWQLAPGVIFSR
jgi:D-lactate dehydrogenase (cytochrome)